MSKIAAVMARSKITVTDLVCLTGVSRPTVTKIIKGEGGTWQMKQEAVIEGLKKVALAVRHGTLPMKRVRSESQDARMARINEAIAEAVDIEKALLDAPEPAEVVEEVEPIENEQPAAD